MRLKLEFGIGYKIREVDWWKELLDFPKLVQFEGDKWEWACYDKDSSGQFDYILTFIDLSHYTSIDGLPVPVIEEMFGRPWANNCECGAVYERGFSGFHMFMCPQWRKF